MHLYGWSYFCENNCQDTHTHTHTHTHTLFTVKLHAFIIFFRTPWEGCLDIQTTGSCLKLINPHCKNVQWKYIKNESCQFYLGYKVKEVLFSVVFPLRAHFAFAYLFLASLIGSGSKITCPKNWAWWNQICPGLGISRGFSGITKPFKLNYKYIFPLPAQI